MSASDWRDQVVAYIRKEAQPEDKFGHQPRLYALAKKIAEDMPHDDDVLFAAAWMHDLGVFLGHRPLDPEKLSSWDHVPYTIEVTQKLLKSWGFPEEKLAAVAEAIRTHQPKDNPTTAEAIILRDADMLEQIGAVGALRAFVKVGRDTRYPTFSSVIPVLRKATHHLPGKMRLTSTSTMAQPKLEVLRSLLAALENEAGDLLF